MSPERYPPRNGYAFTAEELYELTEDGRLPDTTKFPRHYKDGSSIDWLHEEAVERERIHALKAQAGVRGLLLPLLESSRLWLVVILAGMGIGITGAWLDVLVKCSAALPRNRLGDLREGHCSYGFLYNQVACCSGLDPGEKCVDWLTWSEFFHIRSIFIQSLLQCFIYVVLAIAFAGSASLLVVTYAPYAFHTGIPEIKAILGGYVFDAFLSPWTLLIKAVGLALAVASGLSLGKEFSQNEAQKRKLLAAAAAAGVSVAFGSPLGGVLFGLEELDTFASETDVMWRAFVASAIAAVSLQWVNNTIDVWRAFELIPWFGLGIIGGILGALLIRLNVEIALFRRSSYLNDWPVLEVVCASAVTAAISYLVRTGSLILATLLTGLHDLGRFRKASDDNNSFPDPRVYIICRVPASELVANLFQECDSTKPDYHGLCNPTAMWENVFLLVLTSIIKIVFTAWTFGMMIPAGIFLPTIAIGACLGRAVGLLTYVPRINH
ncbi:hypothetical protein C0995_008500 [Termitomyces sp. Mi166|nr:hypothetical protein C0995_008500 [Termitomyces sp. Mi166\